MTVAVKDTVTTRVIVVDGVVVCESNKESGCKSKSKSKSKSESQGNSDSMSLSYN